MKFIEYNEIPGDQYEDEMMLINDENRDNYESMNDDCQLDLSSTTPEEHEGNKKNNEDETINDENRDNYESMNDDCQLDLSFIITPTKHVNINVENEKNTNWAPRNV